RDLTVTGVQTCALPISENYNAPPRTQRPKPNRRLAASTLGNLRLAHARDRDDDQRIEEVHAVIRVGDENLATGRRHEEKFRMRKIGRASCRERVERRGG